MIPRQGRESFIARLITEKNASKEQRMVEQDSDIRWVVVRVWADGRREDYDEFDTEDEATEWAGLWDEQLRLEPYMSYEVEQRASK